MRRIMLIEHTFSIPTARAISWSLLNDSYSCDFDCYETRQKAAGVRERSHTTQTVKIEHTETDLFLAIE